MSSSQGPFPKWPGKPDGPLWRPLWILSLLVIKGAKLGLLGEPEPRAHRFPGPRWKPVQSRNALLDSPAQPSLLLALAALESQGME